MIWVIAALLAVPPNTADIMLPPEGTWVMCSIPKIVERTFFVDPENRYFDYDADRQELNLIEDKKFRDGGGITTGASEAMLSVQINSPNGDYMLTVIDRYSGMFYFNRKSDGILERFSGACKKDSAQPLGTAVRKF